MEHKPQEKISGEISLLDLFDFPDLQREILLCLARYGPADAATLAQSTGLDPAEIQQALAVLLAEGRLRALANGQVDAVIGRAKGLTTLPALLQRGAEVVLGGDWAYFWGEPASQSDVAWGRIAGLCTRDPNQSTVGLTDEEEAVTKGLLKTVYDAASRPATDTDGWAALVRPILDRIQADDRVFFSTGGRLCRRLRNRGPTRAE